VCHPHCVCKTRKRYVVKHNLITEVYLMTVMETTTRFGLYWPSSGCLGNLRASYMHACMRGVETPTYHYNPTPAENNPPPPNKQSYCLVYIHVFCITICICYVSVFHLTPVLIRFDKLCVCRDLYTTRTCMHIASP